MQIVHGIKRLRIEVLYDADHAVKFASLDHREHDLYRTRSSVGVQTGDSVARPLEILDQVARVFFCCYVNDHVAQSQLAVDADAQKVTEAESAGKGNVAAP